MDQPEKSKPLNGCAHTLFVELTDLRKEKHLELWQSSTTFEAGFASIFDKNDIWNMILKQKTAQSLIYLF